MLEPRHGKPTGQIVSQWPQPGGLHSCRVELPGNDAIMHRDGNRLIIEPTRKRGLIALLKSMTPLEEELPEIEDTAPSPDHEL